jgi:hypothetical protein
MVHAGLPEQLMSAHGWDNPTRSGIAVVVNSLVSAHGRAVRPISPAGGEDPLALYE